MNLTERIEDLSTMGASRLKKEVRKLEIEVRIEEQQQRIDIMVDNYESRDYIRGFNDALCNITVWKDLRVNYLEKEMEKLQ